MSALLAFFKFGAVGAGFAFLALVFRLLWLEFQKSPEGRRLPIRMKAVVTIFLFAFVSFSFFISGVFAETLQRDPFTSYVTLDMGRYGFDTTTNTVKFQMVEVAPDQSKYLSKSEVAGYNIILGIRENDQVAPFDGTYMTAIENMKFETIDMREWKPQSVADLEMFKTKCVRFSIFGIPRDDPHPIGATFSPRDHKSIKLFDTRSTGNHC